MGAYGESKCLNHRRPEPTNGKGPKQAVEALTTIIETALDFRGEERPNLTTVAKLASRGSGLLKLDDVDVKISVENAATIAVAQRLHLIS